MELTRELRLEMNALSKEVFGVSSKWQSILKNGNRELVTRKSIETIPGAEGEEPTTKETLIPVLTKDGAKQFVQKNYTLEEIHTMLVGYKKQRDEIMASIEKQKLEKAAKLATEKAMKIVQENAQGSATV